MSAVLKPETLENAPKKPWQFQKGWAGGPGRPKGSRTKFAEDFLKDFQECWSAYGVEALMRMAENKPTEFVKAAVALIPKQVIIDDPIGELNREVTQELLELVRSRAAEIRGGAARIGLSSEGGNGTRGLPALSEAE